MGRTSPPRRSRVSAGSLLLAALLLTPHSLKSQSPPPPRRAANSSHDAGGTGEMSAEEIFRRFASRILFLTCDESEETSGLASGVLVSADGFIVTNAHVVEGCRSMTATYINAAMRRSYEPVLKYYDERSDTAVLKIPDQGLDFFDVPARAVRIGERVYAIGNPRGLEQSISEGIVSGNREEDGLVLIQHSAAISPGSSGGALLSSRGELLGINSFVLRESQNLNFAVPAHTLAQAVSTARTAISSLNFPPVPEIPGSQIPREAKTNPAERPQPAEPATSETEYARGAKYLSLHMYSEAATVLRHYLAAHEFDSAARLVYGAALQGLKQYRSAAEQLELSWRLDHTQSNWSALDHLIDVYLAVYEESRANSDRRKAYDTGLKMREIQILVGAPESERNAIQEAKTHAEAVITTYLSSPIGVWRGASREYEVISNPSEPGFQMRERSPEIPMRMVGRGGTLLSSAVLCGGPGESPHLCFYVILTADAQARYIGSFYSPRISVPGGQCMFESDYSVSLSNGTKLMLVETPRKYFVPLPTDALLKGDDAERAALSLDKMCRSVISRSPSPLRSTTVALDRIQ